MAFQMEVEDTFFFENGSTVFVGTVDGTKFIPPCDCEIVEEGEIKLSFKIDGEMIPARRQMSGALPRSISTRDPIDLDALGLKRKGFTIRSKS